MISLSHKVTNGGEFVTVAERLVKFRGSRPREEVAEAINVSVSAISMYENGRRIPRDEIKVRLADYYGTTVQDIFFNQESHEK